jgi:peroxiredoxin Q/BCP
MSFIQGGAKMAGKKAEIGKKVPSFKLESTDGDKMSLGSFKGKNLVLYFYPKDNTPGCTLEGQDFQKLYKKFQKLNTEVIGISRDSLDSHLKFKDKMAFDFHLLSDSDEKVCEIFDVMKMKSLYGRKFRGIERSTFFIDKKGVLREEWRKVKVPDHAQEVLTFAENFKG